MMTYYSDAGAAINTTTYPDYKKTRYTNWERRKKSEKRIPSLYNRKEDCCGCFACYSICPQEAISMEEDLEGFPYPTVDLAKCIRCYLCEGVCPIKRKDQTKK